MRAGSKTVTPALLRRWPLPAIDGAQGKESRGRVLIVGGSEQIPGGVILAATAALRAGAGKLEIATSRSVAPWVAVAVPEARVRGLRQDRRGELAAGACHGLRQNAAACDAVLIGPGMMNGRAGTELIQQCVRETNGPALVVDASPLAAFARGRRFKRRGGSRLILTPHAGEMASLWGIEKAAVLSAPLEVARQAALSLEATVVLKGQETFIVAPDGTAFRNTAGNDGLGTSGSGDVLAGIIAGLCARGADTVQAAVWGVYLHARAGDALAARHGRDGLLARELANEVPPLLARLAAR